ncbi:hypothetical protein QCM80_45345 [Bradyrhizobium sp. SSUT112]|uniref:hypothetical protein n=1 Tax=Bradyrhizobium sp. SSUT112 TaxID=3040604 RepID=UPI0024475D6A|nr:hypothetical protein [Bradyrhizobium sp. SSUT112]MDH2357695.1 hypothetical protein [Bradyrhizobium sp. SSUT112]
MPPKQAANDNHGWPLKEMYEKGDLGINEIENRNHWFAVVRLKRVLSDSREEPDNRAVVQDDWRELVPEYLEIHEDSLIVQPATDEHSMKQDFDPEFVDSFKDGPGFVDNASWNPHRDIPPHARCLQAKQTLALAADILASDYPIIIAAVDRRWTLRQIGETEGYKDRVTAAACGKGMLRSSLRKLSTFFLSLDRVEIGGHDHRAVWPLVGTAGWLFAEMPDVRWKREKEPLPKAAIYLAA